MLRKDELKKEIEKKRNLALSMYKEIDGLESKLKELSVRGSTIDVYLHSSKEAMYAEGKKAGLSDKQLELFVYACSEITVTLSVNEEGEAEIIAVDGRQFKEEV